MGTPDESTPTSPSDDKDKSLQRSKSSRPRSSYGHHGKSHDDSDKKLKRHHSSSHQSSSGKNKDKKEKRDKKHKSSRHHSSSRKSLPSVSSTDTSNALPQLKKVESASSVSTANDAQSTSTPQPTTSNYAWWEYIPGVSFARNKVFTPWANGLVDASANLADITVNKVAGREVIAQKAKPNKS